MINVYCLYSNNGALTTDDTDVGAFGNISGLVGDSLPDVAIDLNTTETVGFDRFHHPALTAHQRISIAHTVVLALMQVALGKRPHPEEADQRKDGEDQQLQIEPQTTDGSQGCEERTR